ncbi:MAG: glycosyltransferase family 2 protein [Acidimicrobiia bacterium]|nr:glycosyltransferase family 2 protein [Acidimicrobiia bacterium]
MTSPSLTIVIPVHNEAGFVTTAIDTIDRQLAGLTFVMYLVENGSSDGTAAEVDVLSDHYGWLRALHLPQADYGAALREGFRMADTDWMIAFDIDYFSRPFVDEVLAQANGTDIVLASKRDPEADDRRGLLRRLGTRVFNLLLSTLFGSQVTDTHGMKAINRKVLDAVLPTVVSTKDLFDTELVLRAERAGYRIAEVPAVVEEIRPARSSYLKRVPRTLVGLLQLRKLLGKKQ